MSDISSIRPHITPSVVIQMPKNGQPVESVTPAEPVEDTKAVNPQEPPVSNLLPNEKAMADRAEKAKKLEAAVKHVNDFVQNVQRDLHFSVDEDSERTVVKVVEASSGDIIRQIPDENFLEMARKMKEFGEMQLVNATS